MLGVDHHRECPFAMWWLNIWFEIMNQNQIYASKVMDFDFPILSFES